MSTAAGAVTFPAPWLIHPTDSTKNLMLPLTSRELIINRPQNITQFELLGTNRKSVARGPVLGVEADLLITVDHRNPRTYDLAERLRAAMQLETTWLLKLPQHPGPLMSAIPGELFEVSLGQLREVRRPGKTVITIPVIEVGDALG